MNYRMQAAPDQYIGGESALVYKWEEFSDEMDELQKRAARMKEQAANLGVISAFNSGLK